MSNSTQNTQFHNSEIGTTALGAAIDDDHAIVYYLSTAAPPQALKSVWASVVKNSKATLHTPWTEGAFRGAPKMQTVYNPLPGSSYQHMVSISKEPRLITVCDPRGLNTLEYGSMYDPAFTQARHQLLQEHMPTIHRRFAAILNQHTDVPVLPSWAPTLWQAALDEGLGLTHLNAHGDCLAAWLVDTDFNWLERVQQQLAAGRLTIKQPPSN